MNTKCFKCQKAETPDKEQAEPVESCLCQSCFEKMLSEHKKKWNSNREKNR